MKYLSCWLLASTLVNIFSVIVCKFLWIEEPPSWDDPCTHIVYGLARYELIDYHPKPECLNAGMIWLGSYGRFHLWITYPDPSVEEFQFCLLSGGGLDQVLIWWDYQRKHWEPISYPMRKTGIVPKEHCRKSINGTLDIYFESPWMEPRYYSYARWEIKPIIDNNSTVISKEAGDAKPPSNIFKQFEGKNFNFNFRFEKKEKTEGQ